MHHKVIHHAQRLVFDVYEYIVFFTVWLQSLLSSKSCEYPAKVNFRWYSEANKKKEHTKCGWDVGYWGKLQTLQSNQTNMRKSKYSYEYSWKETFSLSAPWDGVRSIAFIEHSKDRREKLESRMSSNCVTNVHPLSIFMWLQPIAMSYIIIKHT